MIKTRKLIFLVAVCAMSTGCAIAPATLKSMSAGQIGCVPDAISVTAPTGITGGLMWNATCSDNKYLCTAISSGKTSDQVSCAVAAQ
jgi:hypothetical protein